MEQKRVLELLEEALEENKSLFVIDVKFSNSNKIDIIIDGDNGVNLKECIRINRYIENGFDREEEDFSLEVSSPDIVSPIKNIRQYNKNMGRILKVKTSEDKYEGTLIEVNSDNLLLEWKAREPKPIGKGKVTVTKQARISFNEIVEAKVKIIF